MLVEDGLTLLIISDQVFQTCARRWSRRTYQSLILDVTNSDQDITGRTQRDFLHARLKQHHPSTNVHPARYKHSTTINLSAALDEGEQDEDKLVATIMGAEDTNGMTDVQQQYKDKIKAQIAKVWPSAGSELNCSWHET